jgi:hypothetical protein
MDGEDTPSFLEDEAPQLDPNSIPDKLPQWVTRPDPKAQYGWYSAEAAKSCGTVIYRTVDGSELEVTTVTDGPKHNSKWEDIKLAGMVVKYLRQGRDGEFEMLKAEMYT